MKKLLTLLLIPTALMATDFEYQKVPALHQKPVTSIGSDSVNLEKGEEAAFISAVNKGDKETAIDMEDEGLETSHPIRVNRNKKIMSEFKELNISHVTCYFVGGIVGSLLTVLAHEILD